MSSQDSKTNNEDTINLVKKFIASNQRKRRNLVNDIELSAESLYKVGEDVIKYVEREGDDWSIGWVLQVLKKYKPKFLYFLPIIDRSSLLNIGIFIEFGTCPL